VHNSGPGSVSYNARDYRLHNTLVDPKPDGTYPWSAGWCAGTWVWTDWAGDDGVDHTVAYVPGTAGANNRWYIAKSAGNSLTFSINDSAGTQRYHTLAATSVNWTASNSKYIETCYNGTNTMIAHHYNASNSTWYNWAAGGDAIIGLSGQTTYVDIGAIAATEMLNGYISNICFAPFSATYSNACWNNGQAPKRPF
jgi:hypothetical protein